MTDKENKDALEYLLKLAETNGVACSTVDDGHMLLFTRAWFEAILEKYPDNKDFLIFVKRPDFVRAN
jgi:hypothetical protein